MSDDDNFTERYHERLSWDEDVYKSVQGKRADAKYGALSEFMRHNIKDTTVCALFCGGAKCKYDTPDNWKDEQMAINGLFSNWVTDNILATARPSNQGIEKYDIIEQFKSNGIKSIINLQTPGEHASCGAGLDPSGFSYNPQTFMDNDVFFYNFGWPDYGVGSLSNILDMVKVTQFALSEGKIAVHCHAGLGRTGVLIACYLIYANRIDPHEVVHYIRSKRVGAIQTRNQVTTIEHFSTYLKPLWIIYSSVDEKAYEFTLQQYMIRQKHLLHGLEAKNLRYIPKIVFVLCERILEIAQRKSYRKRYQRNSIYLMQETAPAAFNNRRTRLNQQSLPVHPSQSIQDLSLLQPIKKSGQGILSKSVDNLTLPSISQKSSQSSPRPPHRNFNKTSYSRSSYNESDSGSTGESEQQHGFSKREVNRKARGLQVGAGESLAIDMTQTEFSDEISKAVEKLQEQLNNDSKAWTIVGEEQNILVLSKLLWDWLDQLKEPILSAQDMPLMLRYTDNPVEGLRKLEKVNYYTVEYLFGIIARLQPLSEETEMELVQRVLSTLTHQNTCPPSFTVSDSVMSTISRRTTNSGEMSSTLTWRLLQFFSRYLTVINNSGQSDEKCENKQSVPERNQAHDSHDCKTRTSYERGIPDGGNNKKSSKNCLSNSNKISDDSSENSFTDHSTQQAKGVYEHKEPSSRLLARPKEKMNNIENDASDNENHKSSNDKLKGKKKKVPTATLR